MLFAQDIPTSPIPAIAAIGSVIGIGLYALKSAYEIKSAHDDKEDRRKSLVEFTKQTVILHDSNETLKKLVENQNKDTQAIALGLDRQNDMRGDVRRIDRRTQALCIAAGIQDPPTETTHTKKDDAIRK